MRSIILSIVILLLSITAKAQHKIESPHPDLVVEIKRAIVSNGTAVIDMLITNMGNEEAITFVSQKEGVNETIAYDDEGNVYKGIQIGSPNEKLFPYWVEINHPQEIPLKFRLQIEKVDPNASQFKLIKIGVSSSGALGLNKSKPIIIHNLEFTK